MINSRTVFVVGAGASKEVGLPTGDQLRSKIAEKVDIRFMDGHQQGSGELDLTDALRAHVKNPDGERGDIAPYLNAGSHIRDAMPQAISIDTFIDSQADEKIELVGKLAIVHSILEEERNSSLFFDEQDSNSKLDFRRTEETWFDSFVKILAEGCRKENIEQRLGNVSFINFNYDRCVEHFLYYALQNYYRISAEEAAEYMRSLSIFHPYGTVGQLPWQNAQGGTLFGGNFYEENLLSRVGEIKTFTEKGADEAVITEIRHLLQNAEMIVFIGFAFHPQNMELIKPKKPGRAKQVFATTKGISKSGCSVVDSQIRHLIRPRLDSTEINLNDLSCHDLFKEYWRSLALS